MIYFNIKIYIYYWRCYDELTKQYTKTHILLTIIPIVGIHRKSELSNLFIT